MYYLIVFFSLSCLTVFDFLKEKANKNVAFILAVFILILFGGLRYAISSDYFNYQRIFNEVIVTKDWASFFTEYGYLWFNFIVNKLFQSFEFFIFIFCMISVLTKSYVISKLSPYPIFSIVIYFVFFFLLDDMGAIRRGFACSLVFYSFYTSFKKQNYTALLFILLAISIHVSAIFAIPFLFLHTYKITNKFFFRLFTISVIFSVFFNNYNELLISYQINLFAYQKFVSYFFSVYNYDSTVVELGLMLRIFFVLYLIRFRNKFVEHIYFENMLSLYATSIFILIIFSKYLIFSSIVIYFKLFEVVLIPIVIKCTFLKYRPFVTAIFFAYVFFSLLRLLKSPVSDFNVYHSILHEL